MRTPVTGSSFLRQGDYRTLFEYSTTVRLFDTDAAGVLFFGNQFRLAHAAYEEFMLTHDLSFERILREGEYMLPIIKTEADYRKPLHVGDRLTIELKAESITDHSYTLSFDLKNEKGELTGKIKTVHVSVDARTWEKTPLPSDLRAALQSIQS